MKTEREGGNEGRMEGMNENREGREQRN